jgi:hypothetical protein
MSTPNGEPFPIEQSSLYQLHLLEKQAIDVHKWLLSEKMGHDVGLQFAMWNWVMGGHRERWLEQVRAKQP